jgi:hypothetical protein
MVQANTARKIEDFDEEDVDAELVFEAPKVKTLRGDIRDFVLTEFKGVDKPWQKMTEREQERLIHRARDIADAVIRGTIDTIANRGFEHYYAQLGKMAVDKGIEAKITMPYTDEAMAGLASRRGQTIIIIARDQHEFEGESRKAEPEVLGDLGLPKPDGDGAQTEAAAPDPETGPERVDPETGEVTIELPGANEPASEQQQPAPTEQ